MPNQTPLGRVRFTWRLPYIRVIRERCSQAVHILDRFHIVAKMNDALDDVRAEEARALTRNGREPVLKKARWCLLKRPDNLTTPQKGRLKELLRYNLKSVRAYLLKEDFQQLWAYSSPIWAGKFLDAWCTTALRSRIEPMKKMARMCRRHRPLILNWFKAKGLSRKTGSPTHRSGAVGGHPGAIGHSVVRRGCLSTGGDANF